MLGANGSSTMIVRAIQGLSQPRRFSLSARLARLGLVIVLVFALIALLTPVLVQLGLLSDPNEGLANALNAGPSWLHWCGTDRLGRDVCSRTLAGSGVALQVVLVALVLALVVGVPLGMVSGYVGGALDRVLVLLMDTLYTLPVLLLSVVLAFLLGRGLPNAAAALCVVYVPQYFRVVRNQTAQLAQPDTPQPCSEHDCAVRRLTAGTCGTHCQYAVAWPDSLRSAQLLVNTPLADTLLATH
jgi:ABC-type dipeptide/oligopeptide/nickel transport system permease subunit